jgi:hypothetical protein
MIVLGTIQSEQFYGSADASQDTSVFSLRTSKTLSSQPSSSFPPSLPTGNTVGGLPAALLSYQQVIIMCLRMSR